MKLTSDFYNRDTVQVAKELLGKILVHEVDGVKLLGMITETEAYLGVVDKASHAYGGRLTERTKTIYGIPGTSYVYFIYGLYYCFNVVTKEEGIPEAVLVRGIEPLEAVRDEMSVKRYGKAFKEISAMQKKDMANGPSKLCMAMGIDRSCNGLDLTGNELYIEDGDVESNRFKIGEAKRIGIDYAEEAKDYLLRFYLMEK